MDAVPGQALLVGAHEEALANRCTGLQMAEIGGTLRHAQLTKAGADGAGADEGYLAAGLPETLYLVGQRLQLLAVQRAVRAGQHVGAHLDHDGLGQRDYFLTDGIEHD